MTQAVLKNPATEAFTAWVGENRVFVQVSICCASGGFELRHISDKEKTIEQLQLLKLDELRNLAQTNAHGAFRPLKSSPDLRTGWRAVVTDGAQLHVALDHLYPGGVADWYATHQVPTPAISYRDFTNRQTGMYRITQMLSDAQVALVTRACCHERFCLKQRHWSVLELELDQEVTKSVLPCLEPCAILLEFARKAMRLEQQDRIAVELGADEVASLEAALESAIANSHSSGRTGDVGAGDNPRRWQLLLEKLKALPKSAASVKDSH